MMMKSHLTFFGGLLSHDDHGADNTQESKKGQDRDQRRDREFVSLLDPDFVGKQRLFGLTA